MAAKAGVFISVVGKADTGAFAKARADLAALEKEAQRAGTGMQAALTRASAKFKSVGQSMTAAGRKLTTSLTLPIVGAAAVSTKLAVDFGDSMTKIGSLVGISQKQVRAWSDEILSLGGKLPQSPKELADALYFVTSSGISVSNAMGVVKASARAAAAGLGETQTVADAVTSAINAYGISNLSAAQATDILTATVREGKGEPEDLAQSIGRVIAPAQAMGISFDQVGAAMASMTLVGLDANEAATALRQVILSMSNPTAEQSAALDQMGLSLAQVRDVVQKQGLLAALQLLRDRSNGNVEAMSALFGNVRALNGFMTLTGKNAGNTARIFDKLAHSTGSADGAFKKTSKSSGFQLRAALSALQSTAIRLNQTILPVLTDIASSVADLAKAFASLPAPARSAVLVVVGLAALLGPLLGGLGALATVIGTIGLPVIAVAAAIGALVAAVVFLWTNWDQVWSAIRDNPAIAAIIAILTGPLLLPIFAIVGIAKWLQANWEQVWSAIQDAIEAVQPVIDDVVGFVTEQLDKMGAWVEKNQALFEDAFSNIATVVRVSLQVVATLLRWLIDSVARPAFEWWARYAVPILEAAWELVKSIIDAALQVIRGVIQTVLALIAGDWGKAWDGVKMIFAGVWDAIVALLQFAWSYVTTIISAGLDLVVKLLQAGWNLAVAVVQGALNLVVSIITGAWNTAVGLVSGAVNQIGAFIGRLPGIVGGIAGSVFNAAVSVGKAIINGIGNGLSAIGGFVTDLGSAVLRAFKNAANWVIDRINDALPNSLGFGPFSVDLPDNPIPRLHSGGVFEAPTPGGEGFAILRDGERVLTTMQQRSLGLTAGGTVRAAPAPTTSGGDIVVNITIDARGASNPAEIEAAARRGTEAGVRTAVRELTRLQRSA